MRTIPTIACALFITTSATLVGCDSGSDMDASVETEPATSTTDASVTVSSATTSDGAESTTAEDATTSGAGSTTSEEAGSSSTGEAIETAGNSERFEDVISETGMQALLDLETNLLWVNDVNACNPLGAPNEDTPMLAMQYCDDLVFQGFEDWRIPTPDEAIELITVALEEGVDLVYQNPGCPAVIAMGGVAVETHNGDNPGDVTEMPPSLGIRCVRMNG